MKRIWHPWTEWECYPAGLYDGKTDYSPDRSRQLFTDFLRDDPRFRRALARVIAKWPKSCEHFLSNEGSNRIAWLGQAAVCISTGISCVHRGGFCDLTEQEREVANATAKEFLDGWILHEKIRRYIEAWMSRGYPDGIPDEVPDALMAIGLAPSYKAIAFAILKNDASMKSLGFSTVPSPWYSELKRIEIAERAEPKPAELVQRTLFGD